MTKSRSSSRASKPSFTRNIIHGTNASKSGAVSRSLPDSRKSSRRINNATSDGRSLKQLNHNYNTTIVAPPPKKEIVLARNETRFTLPDSPQNSAIRLSQLRRTQVAQSLLFHELKTELKCRQGAVSPRVEMLA
jgi:hypothetical protein